MSKEVELVICKKCKAEFEKGKKRCPNCNKKVVTPGKIVFRVIMGVVATLFLLTVAINVMETIAYNKLSPEEKIEYDKKQEEIRQKEAEKKAEEDKRYIIETDNSILAYDMSKRYIESKLVSPSTAKFPIFANIHVIKNEDVYTVSAYVDSQNSFGAMLRTNFIIKIQQVGKDPAKTGSWLILESQID